MTGSDCRREEFRLGSGYTRNDSIAGKLYRWSRRARGWRRREKYHVTVSRDMTADAVAFSLGRLDEKKVEVVLVNRLHRQLLIQRRTN